MIASLDPDGLPRATYISEVSTPEHSDRCLVLDAAFNPPTNAHVALALNGARSSRADRILYQLSLSNVDKSVSGADLGQRLYMLDALAKADESLVSICSHARFVDKARALQSLSPQTVHIFAIGYDTLIRLFDPKYYTDIAASLDELFALAEFAVANRSEHDTQSVVDYLAGPSCKDYADKIHQITLPPEFADVSSSGVRDRIHRSSDVSGWIPNDIASIIKAMGLYKK